MFGYAIETERRFYLANGVEVRVQGDGARPLIEVELTDAWVWDMSSPGGLLGEGEILEVDPPRKLAHTLHALWSDDVAAEGFSRVTWEIEQVADSCRLVVTHDQLREGANDQLYGGWPMILSGLKTWLETGTLLTTPGSLMYAQR